jgi:competence protein ComEA
VKKYLPVLIAAAIGAFVLLRPLPPPAAPTAAAGAWSAEAPGSRGKHERRPPPRAMVYVAGEVVRPGVYAIGPDARVRDALALAGGAKPDGDLVAVNLAAHASDGDEIVVPPRGAANAAAAAPGGRSGRRRRRGGRHGAADGGAGFAGACAYEACGSDGTATGATAKKKRRRSHGRGAPPPAQVDINTADADTLATIPGIGGGLAQRIVAFREQNGPFASVDELLDVAGITEHRLDAILPYVVAR